MKLELENPGVARASSGKTTTLWLVDDNAAYRQMLADNFNETGGIHCERQFASAEALLAALETDAAPDVILSDIQMEGMSGVEAAGPVKRLAPATHLVLLTSFYDSADGMTARRAGAAGILLKCSAFTEILEFVQDSMAGRHPRDSAEEDAQWRPSGDLSSRGEFIHAGPVQPMIASWRRGTYFLRQFLHLAVPDTKT